MSRASNRITMRCRFPEKQLYNYTYGCSSQDQLKPCDICAAGHVDPVIMQGAFGNQQILEVE